MKTKIALMLLLVVSNGLAAKYDFSNMSEAEKKITGINKLNAKEQQALADWINNKQIIEKKAEKAKKAGFEMSDGDREVIISSLVNIYKKQGFNYFVLSNGQVWKQNNTAQFHVKKNSKETVKISPKMMGSWAIQVGGGNRSVKVKRVK
ncbi:MAG: hypothetical protein L3J52_02565 [Proteobacteria bacterium]|nr:hypothetical protein [Pseudomonadota bacterium]